MFDQSTLNSAWGGASTAQPKAAAKQPKNIGGIKGFLVKSLPAIGSGLGAVAGIPLDVLGGAGSIAGGAAGGALGESLKRKLLGENQSLKQSGIQALEGGVGAAVQPLKLLKGGSGIAKNLVNPALKEGAATAAETTAEKGGFLKNLVTQGQQAQGRVAGISAGSKAAGKQLTPQDTERMLTTIKNEGLQTGNANNLSRDLQDKLGQYGKQIGDHFKANNAPLKPEDAKVISANFLTGLKTTDPAVIKQAQILSNDLEKNVKDTKSLWEFRKSLDSRIPDAKQAAGSAPLTAKMSAIKEMRGYIANELGDVPGMKNYHDLAEIKPFVLDEAKRANNPGGGIIGRVLASGPAQKGEDLLGKGAQKLAAQGTTKLEQDAAALSSTGKTPILQQAVGAATTPLRAAAAPLAYPGKSIAQVTKQEALRLPGGNETGNQTPAGNQPAATTPSADLGNSLLQASANAPTESNNPYDPSNAEANVQAILKQGGTSKDVAEYLSAVKAYQALTPSSGGIGKPTAQQYGLAQSGVQSLQQLAGLIDQDPSIVEKNATPGQGTPLIGSLISNAAGASNYHSLADNILSSLIHLQTGATATPSEITAAHGQLPQPGDSAEVRARKVQTLMSNFEPFLAGQ